MAAANRLRFYSYGFKVVDKTLQGILAQKIAILIDHKYMIIRILTILSLAIFVGFIKPDEQRIRTFFVSEHKGCVLKLEKHRRWKMFSNNGINPLYTIADSLLQKNTDISFGKKWPAKTLRCFLRQHNKIITNPTATTALHKAN